MRRCIGACICILAFAFGSDAALAAPFSFAYPKVGLGTPFTVSAGGISAQFLSNGDPYGFHVEPSTFFTITGSVLIDSGISPDSNLVIGIAFSEAVDSVSFGFALDSTVSSTLYLLASNGSSLASESSAAGQVPSGGGIAEGMMTFSGMPFDELLIADPTDPAFAIGEITVSAIPEPVGWASLGLGLLALAEVRRRRYTPPPPLESQAPGSSPTRPAARQRRHQPRRRSSGGASAVTNTGRIPCDAGGSGSAASGAESGSGPFGAVLTG